MLWYITADKLVKQYIMINEVESFTEINKQNSDYIPLYYIIFMLF